MPWNAIHNLFWAVTMIAAALVWGGMFVSGLRQRSVITMSNFKAERDHSPLLYWAIQTYYALVVVACITGSFIFLMNYHVTGSVFDKIVMVLFGNLFLLAGVLLGVYFATGLRTGVAIRSKFIARPPPTRDANPLRYWVLQSFYVFAICLVAFLGLVLIAQVIWT